MPIESPTSASLSAGASLVPSPVTATTSPVSFSRCWGQGGQSRGCVRDGGMARGMEREGGRGGG
eukprot:3263707-Rhodomonas_salina.2